MSAQPDLLYSEEEEALRAAVRDLLTDHCDAASVIVRTESDAPHDLSLWKSLADGMGLAGLLVPEVKEARAPRTAKSPSSWRSWAARSPRFRTSRARSSPPRRSSRAMRTTCSRTWPRAGRSASSPSP